MARCRFGLPNFQDSGARNFRRAAAASEAFAADVSRRDSAEWRKEYGLRLALESARRMLTRHHLAKASLDRAPAEALLNLRDR